MTHTKKAFWARACACVFAAALALCALCACSTNANTTKAQGEADGNGISTGNASGSGTLVVGVRDDIVSFSQYNEKTGRYYGMEVDLAEEMASRLGYATVEFKTVTPDTRKEMLQSGEVDALVACYSVSESREKNFDFSPAYYTDAIRLLVEKSSLVTSVNDLKGGVIGTVAGANTAPILLQEFKSSGFSTGEIVSANDDNTDVTFDTWHLLEYDSYQELSDALEVGEVDAAAMDGAISNTFMDSKRMLVEDFSVDPQEYAVATQKDSELSGRVSSAVQSMIDDGTIDALIDKWN